MLSEEPPGAKTRSDQERDSQPQAAAAPIIAEPPARKPRPRVFAAGAIKRLFSKIAKAVITELAPKPRRKRKRDDDTRGLFKRLAMRLLAPAAETIFALWDFNCFTPPAALDETQRLLLRERYSGAAVSQSHQNQAVHYDHSTDLSPRP
jgi:hypothetical protein